MIKIHFKNVLLFLFFLILFSCTSDNTEVQENPILPISDKKIITIYNKEKALDIWNNHANEWSVSQALSFNRNNDFNLGLYEVDSILDNYISLKKDKGNFLKIQLEENQKINADNLIDLNNYKVLVLASRPNEYGTFQNNFHKPKYSQEALLKSKLEWEGIFGIFETYRPKDIVNAD